MILKFYIYYFDISLALDFSIFAIQKSTRWRYLCTMKCEPIWQLTISTIGSKHARNFHKNAWYCTHFKGNHQARHSGPRLKCRLVLHETDMGIMDLRELRPGLKTVRSGPTFNPLQARNPKTCKLLIGRYIQAWERCIQLRIVYSFLSHAPAHSVCHSMVVRSPFCFRSFSCRQSKPYWDIKTHVTTSSHGKKSLRTVMR